MAHPATDAKGKAVTDKVTRAEVYSMATVVGAASGVNFEIPF
jgi:hypothetical protein